MNFLKQLFVEILNLLFGLYNNKLKLFGILFAIIFILSFIYIQNFLSFLLGILMYICTTFLILLVSLLIPLLISLLVIAIMTSKTSFYDDSILLDFRYTKYPILNSILYYGSLIGTYCYSVYKAFIIEGKQAYIEVTKTLIMPVLDNLYILEELCEIFK
jgi:hypothetical protein